VLVDKCAGAPPRANSRYRRAACSAGSSAAPSADRNFNRQDGVSAGTIDLGPVLATASASAFVLVLASLPVPASYLQPRPHAKTKALPGPTLSTNKVQWAMREVGNAPSRMDAWSSGDRNFFLHGSKLALPTRVRRLRPKLFKSQQHFLSFPNPGSATLETSDMPRHV
jgi:hypothetical protein